ncbi:hypothetical protein GJ496_011432 [Pomphorhynchus laevis]|nr:hypothetical protein GJ496_011432 [Pomphorhynchus laevis]
MQSISSGTKLIITGSRSPMSVLTKQRCGSELQQSITTESLSGNIGCNSFDTCNNHKVNGTEGELDRCGPWRRLSNSILSNCAHVESESNKRTRHKLLKAILGSTIEAKSLLNRGLRLKNQPAPLLKDLYREERILLLNAKQELARRRCKGNYDTALINLESLPSGYNVRQRIYRDFQETMLNVAHEQFGDNHLNTNSSSSSTANTSQVGTENTNLLPNSGASQNTAFQNTMKISSIRKTFERRMGMWNEGNLDEIITGTRYHQAKRLIQINGLTSKRGKDAARVAKFTRMD